MMDSETAFAEAKQNKFRTTTKFFSDFNGYAGQDRTFAIKD